MITLCPHCGKLYETTTENANTPSWCGRKARWCPECLGIDYRAPRLSEHERRRRAHYDRLEWRCGG